MLPNPRCCRRMDAGIVRGGRCLRMCHSQHVAMGPPLPPRVLEHLVQGVRGRTSGIPPSHRPSHPASPTAEGVEVPEPLEQVGSGACHAGHRSECGRPRGRVTVRGGQCQGKERCIVPRGASRGAHLHDARHRARTIGGQALEHRGGILEGELALGHVVCPALAPQHEEAVEAHPMIHGPGMSARRVGHLRGCRHRRRLRRGQPVQSRREVLREIHSLALLWSSNK